MFPFKKDYSREQKNFSRGIKNTCDYIIVHHTATPQGTLQGNLNGLLGIRPSLNPNSAHFLVDGDGSAYKLADPDMVTWHAGKSMWGNIVGMNYHALGIEIIGPDFTDAQRKTVRLLIQHLMAVFSIPGERVLRHADICWAGSAKKKLWDGVSTSRKVDVDESFWKIDRTTWKQYQESLVPKAL